MLSSCSPSATLQSDTDSWRGAFHESGAQFLQLTSRGHPLIAWLWWMKGLAFLDPTGLWQSEDDSWQATTTRAIQRQQTEAHAPVFL